MPSAFTDDLSIRPMRDGCLPASAARIAITGAVRKTHRRPHRAWRRSFNLYGPLIPLALGFGLCAGGVLAFVALR